MKTALAVAAIAVGLAALAALIWLSPTCETKAGAAIGVTFKLAGC